MANAPKLNFPDGSGVTTSLTVSTNQVNLLFTGIVDSNIIDIQIDINGAGFISDPSLIELDLPKFSIPNSLVFPQGLELERGLNTIRLRAIDISGDFSPISIITVTVIADTDLNSILAPPTGVLLQRNAQTIQLEWSDDINANISGYNIYASSGAGGSSSGYLRLNKDVIPSTSPTKIVEEEFDVADGNYVFDNPGTIGSFGGAADVSDVIVADLILKADLKDAFNNADFGTASINRLTLGADPKYKVQFSLKAIRQTAFFEFIHNRNDGITNGILNSDSFSVISPEDPLFYVITAVYFDKLTGQLQESRFSNEIGGAPLSLDTTVRGIRIREQNKIAQDYIQEVNQAQPTLALIPASTVREVHIEPFANEAQKMYFLMDFVHRAKSFSALLQIDDPGFTGTSISVANSTYKQNLRSALSLSSDAAVQSLIDGAFDSLAANFTTPRLGRRPAQVLQTFYTTSLPTRDLVVIQGAIISSSNNPTAPRFKTNGSVIITADNARAFYNPTTRRYEIRVQMIAETPGAIGNVPANTMNTVVSGADGLQTINEFAADFGRDRQSNLELSVVSSRKLSALDTGTEGGYYLTAIGTPGLIEVRIVLSGDPSMMRDYDSVRMKHIGGKVDIWIKGVIERTITESFAFQFSIAKNIRFDVINPVNLTFRARDSRLSESNPINGMLFNPSQGLGLRNHSNLPTTSYDLTGVEIVDFRTIRLNTSIPQSITNLDDFIEGDYRFRSNNRFIASFQPIRRITSVIGEVSGPLDADDGFTLFKLEDPLLNGESTIAQDYVEINQVNGIPAGNSLIINDENHVMIGEFEELLNSVGINTFTVRVFSQDRSLEFKGPNQIDPDYLIIQGNKTKPISLIRTSNSNITSGQTISVDYEHDENFTVTYVINDVLQSLQKKVLKQRHATADVLCKQALENPLSTEATVQLSSNPDQSATDTDIRTNVTILTDSRGVGGSVRQSDMVSKIDNSAGVDYVVQPFTRFTLADGAQRIRDIIPSDYIPVPTLNKFANAVYLLRQALPFDTIDGGGTSNIHHGVFMDELIIDLATSLEDVSNGMNRAWIIGRLGAVIPGYSDDATLLPIVFIQSAIAAERIRRTANRIIVSLNGGLNPADVPTNHAFAASYVVQGDRGVKDIETSQIEYLTPGSLTLTYRS
jgi:uncharacterized phage protein gp47/JayE